MCRCFDSAAAVCDSVSIVARRSQVSAQPMFGLTDIYIAYPQLDFRVRTHRHPNCVGDVGLDFLKFLKIEKKNFEIFFFRPIGTNFFLKHPHG